MNAPVSLADRAADYGALANVEAEQALLGAALSYNTVAERARDLVAPADFSMAVHERIWSAALEAIDRGEPANPVMLRSRFADDEALKGVGGGQYLARLAGAAITVINVEHYARLIHELAEARRLHDAGLDMQEGAFRIARGEPASQVVAEAERSLLSHDKHSRRWQPIGEALQEAMRRVEAAHKSGGVVGITTGLASLDEAVGGWGDDDLVLIAGRPGMGKTGVMLHCAQAAAKAGHGVAIGSLEMANHQLAARLIAEWCGLEYADLRRGRVDAADFARMAAVANQIAKLPIWIQDMPAPTISELRSQCRRACLRHPVDLVMVDYLQLALPDRRSGNKVADVTEVSNGLKALAKELHKPVVALAQLSRGVEGREDKRPMLADLRESGALEQDADTVIFLYREHYYLSRKRSEAPEHIEAVRRTKHLIEFIVGKNRHGGEASVTAWCDMATNRFRELAAGEEPGQEEML